MILNEIEINNFRNIEYAKLSPGKNLTVICGKNGQGKTNIIESIWMLCGGKSFRNVKDAFLIKKNENFSIINANVNNVNNKDDNEKFNCDNSQIKIIIANEENKKGRFAFVNGIDYGRAVNIAGIVNSVVFEPNYLKLVKGGPENRRKFIDGALCQLYPSYISLLRKYMRITQQKNSLLKQYYKTNGADKLLDIYNENMAECGELIVNKRLLYFEKLKILTKKHHKDITGNKENLSINYNKCYDDKLIIKLNENKNKEINAGFCLIGPHREDLIFNINDNDAKVFASQGQQRSIVLALKLAEAEIIYDVTSEKPIVLLDDVLSELDEMRQHYLLNEITSMQTIISSCEPEAFKKTNGEIYYVENGVVKN